MEYSTWVGPVLTAGAVAQALIEGIRELNRDVMVQDRGAYLRVLAPGRCVVTQAIVSEKLGRTFELPGDLEQIMSTFKGRFQVTGERAEWTFDGHPVKE